MKLYRNCSSIAIGYFCSVPYETLLVSRSAFAATLQDTLLLSYMQVNWRPGVIISMLPFLHNLIQSPQPEPSPLEIVPLFRMCPLSPFYGSIRLR